MNRQLMTLPAAMQEQQRFLCLMNQQITWSTCQIEAILSLCSQKKKYVIKLLNEMESKKIRVLENFILVEEIDADLKDRATKLGITLYSYHEIIKQGKTLTFDLPPIDLERVFSLVVTSGSTGMPKAVMARNKVMIAIMAGYWGRFLTSEDVICANINFAYNAMKFTVFISLSVGGTVVFFGNNFEKTCQVMREVNPTHALLPPIFLNKTYPVIQKMMEQMPAEKRDMIKMLVKKKIEYMMTEKKIEHPEIDKFLFPIKAQLFGTRLREALFLGSTIHDKILWFFRSIMMCPLRSLYGQSESGSPCTLGTAFGGGDNVGLPVEGYDFKIIDCPSKGYYVTDKKNGKPAPRGELCIRGMAVTTGYLEDKEKTKEIFDKDGWLLTKDIMELDPETHTFRIIDRVNNIKKLCNEEFIASELLEKFYESSEYVSQIYIHVESDKECIVAIIYPDPTALEEWSKKKGLTDTFENLCQNEELVKTILDMLHKMATDSGLNLYEHIAQLKLSSTPFTQENGCLTFSLKLRRNNIEAIYKEDIKKLYARASKK
eukprot:TRINITY_DN1015_c0_g1_i2.p1 TRINITY_DN1015_c0_g1~~TRINITY_DN1015_c0_g1_i2.p1  ORF type:complete len:545 (-),score=76.03 TRINITY_DN1015_c0_g1_i2:53-1687(-)